MAGIRVSAPGKVILHGEHAVVYGKTAIAVSVGLRTTMDVEVVKEYVILLMPDLNKSYSWPTEQLRSLALLINIPSQQSPQAAPPEVLTKIRHFLNTSDPDNGVISFLYLYLSLLPHCPPLSVRITSDIPIGAGLGSSAAMSVCFASGLLLYGRNIDRAVSTNGNEIRDDNENLNKSGIENGSPGMRLDVSTKEKELICSWAFMGEKIMHGTPSGIDNSVSTYGGVVTFCSGSMTPQPALSGLDILLTNTQVGRNTRQLVAAVKERYEMFPKVVEPIMEAVDKLSLAALNTFQACRVKNFSDCSTEFSQLESLVDMNQGLLASLGVSHPSLEKVIQITAGYGLHTKLTGAGGGGVAFSLVTPGTDMNKVEKAKSELELSGFQCYTASIGGAGVMAWDLQLI